MRYEVQIVEHCYYTIEVEANNQDEAVDKAVDDLFGYGYGAEGADVDCCGIKLLDNPEAEYYEANLINNDAFDESKDEEFESILFCL